MKWVWYNVDRCAVLHWKKNTRAQRTSQTKTTNRLEETRLTTNNHLDENRWRRSASELWDPCGPYGPQSSEAERPHQLFSARCLLVVKRVSSSLIQHTGKQESQGGGRSFGLKGRSPRPKGPRVGVEGLWEGAASPSHPSNKSSVRQHSAKEFVTEKRRTSQEQQIKLVWISLT